ncbi:hypothetical protein [Shewanella litorisediminis]|uniref:Pyrrolidone-carboxylate peptidase n=1 Tax=Shewanella litorisediminis TaxID=1173586 RepID=A0ABX7G4V2_9GAMM|nr:hypothetical protein [Shewanella litorisediminis]MCL2917911.1 hypothetical protein [Shewanella litorisediminis]QRH02346.1 hypothetical protein JQC75_02670 [Shewanella litorisediminis]
MLKRMLPALFIAGVGTLPLLAQANLDVEELRLPKANSDLGGVANRYQGLIDGLKDKLAAGNEEKAVTQAMAYQGIRLWQQAVRDVQSGHMDDRSLYWARLAMRASLKQDKAGYAIVPWQRDILVRAVETASRGFSDIHFGEDVQIRILLTGFDPFFLDRNIGQSNPSGITALMLDGYKFKVGGKQAQIETVMIPVRFADFDQGMIESLLTPFYRKRSIDAVFTVSMGRDDFDLERFPGRNRSAEAPDNLNVLTGATKTQPIAPMLNGKSLNGDEFVEFSLPVTAMQAAPGNYKVNDNHRVTTLGRGTFEATSLAELQEAISVEGSGGGYLSNEISYRAVLLRDQFGLKLPVGHIHTPKVAGYDAQTGRAIAEQVRAMVELAAATL